MLTGLCVFFKVERKRVNESVCLGLWVLDIGENSVYVYYRWWMKVSTGS